MQEQQAKSKQHARVSQLAASKKFGKYKKEEAKRVRTQNISENKTLEEIKKVWRECRYDWEAKDNVDISSHRKFLSMLSNVGYTANDVELFAIVLAEFQEEDSFSTKAGVFLSALINGGKDEKYIISTRQFHEPIQRIGIENHKDIIIIGDVDRAGSYMKTGSIVVQGHANRVAYFMEGGRIIVEGNVYLHAGNHMKSGNVIIRKNAHQVGWGMDGGSISVEGEIGSIGDVKHGKIFHKGKLIVNK